MTMSTENPGRGLDVGTMNLVSAREKGGQVVTKRVRDCFLDLEPEAKKHLKMTKVPYVEHEGALVVLGDSAMQYAALFKRDVRRPLARGVIAAGELDAQQILSLLVFNVLDVPLEDGELCYYSVPAAPIDDPGQDVVYHQEVFRKIIGDHGYKPMPANEAMAVIYSQCADTMFSGVGISFGSGMVNVALAYQTVQALAYSHTRAGDWVDTHAAKAIGSTPVRVCTVKEKGVDLKNPSNRDQEAIAMYIRASISYTLTTLAQQMAAVKSSLELHEPIPMVLSGGMTKAGSFMAIFQEELESIRKKLPFQVSEVRVAKDPMTAVAEGLLVLAQQEELPPGPRPCTHTSCPLSRGVSFKS